MKKKKKKREMFSEFVLGDKESDNSYLEYNNKNL